MNGENWQNKISRVICLKSINLRLFLNWEILKDDWNYKFDVVKFKVLIE